MCLPYSCKTEMCLACDKFLISYKKKTADSLSAKVCYLSRSDVDVMSKMSFISMKEFLVCQIEHD